MIIAHRGASGHATENTLTAMDKALELDCDAIEIDVWQVEGQLIVFHDLRLERLTNGHGRITDISLSELRALRMGDSEKIPLIDEVLDLIAGRVALNIEIKGAGCTELVIKAIRQRLSNGWKLEQFLVSSFNHQALYELHQQAPEIQTGLLLEEVVLDPFVTATLIGATSLNISYDCLDAELIESAHDRGLKVYVYTVNEKEYIANAIALGADGIFTNYPDRAPKSASLVRKRMWS
jgi:glycerophosphoryl diester phosphodiesterase